MEDAVFVTKTLCSSMRNKNKTRAFVQATADAPAPVNAGINMPKQPASRINKQKNTGFRSTFSPVQSARKFSAVLGTLLPYLRQSTVDYADTEMKVTAARSRTGP
jgi:hypothetical protein